MLNMLLLSAALAADPAQDRMCAAFLLDIFAPASAPRPGERVASPDRAPTTRSEAPPATDDRDAPRVERPSERVPSERGSAAPEPEPQFVARLVAGTLGKLPEGWEPVSANAVVVPTFMVNNVQYYEVRHYIYGCRPIVPDSP